MFKGSFIVIAEALAARSSAGTPTVAPWQRVADAWRDGGASAGAESSGARARLTVIRPSFSLHQVQSLPPR